MTTTRSVGLTRTGRVLVCKLSANEVSEVVLTPAQLTVSLHPDPETGGKGLIEYSTSPETDVKAGAGLWIDWAFGEVAVATSSVTEGQLTAIRGRCTEGRIVLEVVRS